MITVELKLVRNPKAQRRGTGVLVPSPDFTRLEWRNPLSRHEYGGTWAFEPGEFFVTVSDWSSHKNSRRYFDLHRLGPDGKIIDYPVWASQENKVWEAQFFEEKGKFNFIARIASAFTGKSPGKLSKLEVLDFFFLAAIKKLIEEEREKPSLAPHLPLPEGWEWLEVDGIALVHPRDAVLSLHFPSCFTPEQLGKENLPAFRAFFLEQAEKLEALARVYRTLAEMKKEEER